MYIYTLRLEGTVYCRLANVTDECKILVKELLGVLFHNHWDLAYNLHKKDS